MKHYPEEFWEQGSHGHAYRLLSEAALPPGVVLDLGCASGPLAEPVQALGHEYVGADVDRLALDELTGRGFEGHEIDLLVAEDDQVRALEGIVGDRPLRAVLLLDVLEHLLDPAATLRAIGRLEQAHEGLQIVVSIPNVSHVDVGIKLLMGRWDLTDIGLLDDTHVRFFNHRVLAGTMAETGWGELAADDVVNPFSDQLFPADAPALRPGTPLRQLLCRVRMAADPYGETYQFVRRYGRARDAAAAVRDRLGADEGPVIRGVDDTFLSVVVRAPAPDGSDGRPSLAPLLDDLARQSDGDLEVLVSVAGDDRLPALPEELAERVRRVGTAPGEDWRDGAVRQARGRYVVVLDHRTRVTGDYVATLRQLVDALPARVVQVGACSAPLDDLASPGPVEERLASFEAVALDPLDLVGTTPLGAVALDAYAVPRQVWIASGFGFAADAAEAGSVLFLLSAVEMCGIVRSADPVVAVHPAVVRSLVACGDEIGKHLGQHPMVLPEGAGALLLPHRSALATALPERDALAAELGAVRDQVRWLTEQLRDRDARLAEHHRALMEVERLPGMRLRRKMGAVKRRLMA